MKISVATIHGFRLLKDAVVHLDPDVTIVVGRNNSGKTSLVEAFYKFVGTDSNTFTLDDFNLELLLKLRIAGELWLESQSKRNAGDAAEADRLEGEAIDAIPAIRLDVEFEYDEVDSLAPLADLIMDLDPERHDALVSCRFQAARPLEMLRAFAIVNADSGLDLVEFLRRRLGSHFEIAYVALDKNDFSNVREVSRAQVRDAAFCNFVYAQNLFDDTSLDNGHGLSRGFESYYRAISDTDGTVESLELALADVARQLDGEYLTLFEGVFRDLREFGVNRMPSLQDLKVVSEFRAADLLNGSTKVMYAHGADASLPEAHNGLGYSKLIFIILQFIAFFEAYNKRQPVPGVQLLFVEEPEAHLHPQMQSVFIKNIREYLSSKPGWNVQLVVTTHSSHIVAESGFTCIRYFDASDDTLQVRDLSAFRSKLKATDEETLKFLEQYMVLHRCDMFFADKVVLIEGAAERLVLPAMIMASASDLAHQYVSVIEVGGAYAVKFRPLLEFINVQTLVITDIDSVAAEGNHPKVPVKTTGAITSNVTLKTWLPSRTTIADLLVASDDAKLDRKARVAYQIAEIGRTECGRSFEEAFILANAEALATASQTLSTSRLFLDENGECFSAEVIRERAYEIAKQIDSKSDFAFDALKIPNWVTPRYISEGLEWLAPQSR
ncbi:putative ATP-dependent endonuclease of OLD family [Cryobacterium mesophilum]|uniref:ATP-dependent nuclease n=1 Tax=Terrimesophilobacter mesophilus TaxID=433647 RepID=UPI0014258B71|nr:AAA family ATPase [Terrimesophilobacter mesophilus]MBB5633639.1 putative ATP-dependent endonuclease of OLD family [Terrimesophilobacter mesophilus]